MPVLKRAAWLSWITVALLAASCCVLAILQYRWISEFAEAERARLAADLDRGLTSVSRSLTQTIAADFATLIPSPSRADAIGPEKAFAESYHNFRASRRPIFRRIALVIRRENELEFLNLNLDSGEWSHSDWPEIREILEARARHQPEPPMYQTLPPLLESHGFGGDGEHWLIAELNLDYLREKILPVLLNRYLASSGKLDYDWDLQPAANAATDSADAFVNLFNNRPGPPVPPPDPDRERDPGPPPRGPFDHRPPPNFAGAFEHSSWLLVLHHHGGSLQSFVSQARSRNIAASAGLLLLILATVAALIRVTRQSQHLAAAQMDFVAGVSHELRTPLTVIRTAAYNLQRNVAQRPGQVEEYGELIQEQSEKLTALVEQILRFARGEAGHVIGPRKPVQIEDLIDQSLDFSGEPLGRKGITVEKRIPAGLPPILADRLALRRALENLIENAVKYGTAWVGVFVSADDAALEIRIADRGPGIPEDEQKHIFDPFFRGRRALSDQIRGAGLGLSLAKKIIEAHGGTIRVESNPLRGSEFIIRLPAAPGESTHEVEHSLT